MKHVDLLQFFGKALRNNDLVICNANMSKSDLVKKKKIRSCWNIEYLNP